MVGLTVARRVALIGGGVTAAVLIAFGTLAPSASAQTPTATPAPPKATTTATPATTTATPAAPKATTAAATPAATGAAGKAAATPVVEATDNTTMYLLIGAVVILAIGAAVYLMRRRA